MEDPYYLRKNGFYKVFKFINAKSYHNRKRLKKEWFLFEESYDGNGDK